MPAQDPLGQITRRQNAEMDSILGNFRDELDAIMATATSRLQSRLASDLTLDAQGNVAATTENRRLLSQISKLFERELTAAGYPLLVQELVAGFNSQFPFFDEALRLIGLPPVKFSAADADALLAQQLAIGDALQGMVGQVVQVAQRRALLALGNISLGDLANLIATQANRTVPEAVSLADTSLNVFYRTIAQRGFQSIEAAQGVELRYRYYGPDDKKTRPYCEAMLKRTDPDGLTMAEIDQYPNGQLDNPFQTGGGYNCRHWYIVVPTPPAGTKTPAPSPVSAQTAPDSQNPAEQPPFSNNGVAPMGSIPSAAQRAVERYFRFNNRDGKVIWTRPQFESMVAKHPELNWKEAALAVLNPDRVIADKTRPNTALFLRRKDQGSWYVTVVKFAERRGQTKNSIISARVQRDRTVSKLGESIWSNTQ